MSSVINLHMLTEAPGKAAAYTGVLYYLLGITRLPAAVFSTFNAIPILGALDAPHHDVMIKAILAAIVTYFRWAYKKSWVQKTAATTKTTVNATV